MKLLIGAGIGIAAAIALLAVGGFVLGGINRAAPCGESPDFMSGAIFGVFLLMTVGILPAGIAGGLIGTIVGAILQFRRPVAIVCFHCQQEMPRKRAICPHCGLANQ